MRDNGKIGSGIPITIDNVGIEGVTEFEVGTLLLEVGEPIDVTPDLVDETRILRFEMELSDDPSGTHYVQRKLNNGGVQNLISLDPTTYQVVEITPKERPKGDLDNNGEITKDDIDILTITIFFGGNDPDSDLNNDGRVDLADHLFLVRDLKKTWFGDANLDGEFNSRDLIDVFQAGKYQDGVDDNTGWAHGDWNADRDFDTSDLVAAFQDGGYDAGPREAVTAVVPEPSAMTLVMLGLFAFTRARKSDG